MQKQLQNNGGNYYRIIMNKFIVQQFRRNDLIPDTGKQVEFGKAWTHDFFGLDNSIGHIILNVTFKALCTEHKVFDGEEIKLELAEPTNRQDRKAYSNGSSGFSQLKDFFINKLGLSCDRNCNDYFAMLKVSKTDYYLYFVPNFIYKNFIQFFQSLDINVRTEKNRTNFTCSKSGFSNQVIFYGAPGTGKSHTIKELTKGKNVIRTTFHPDSDYSTFVGAYKPTTTKVKVRDSAGHVVVDEGKEVTEERIVYKFIEQAFLESYINAWKLYAKSEQSTKPEEQYLVIEEINRGNCAQIFGDLFQLLDRKANGFSDYPIKTDSDIQKHLANAFSDLTILNSTELDEIYKDDVKNASAKIKNGDVLILPPNLYIWATMNTSDQSLFPIDSAFKRRWDWMYSPIKNNHEMTIDINGTKYSWTEFQKEVNKRIFADTNSEDKLLGDYFVNPSDGIITEEVLVNKVLFYLWNDVCKDGDGDIFKKADGDVLTFSELYNNDDSISTDNLLLLMKHLELEPEAEESAENQETESVEDIDRDEEGNDAPLAESIE